MYDEMVSQDKSAVVPIEELIDLANKWAGNTNPAEFMIRDITDNCAQDLRNLIEDYQ